MLATPRLADIGQLRRIGDRRRVADRAVGAGPRCPRTALITSARASGDWMMHTTATTAALYTSVTSGAMPIVRIIIVIDWMMNAPITVPVSEKRPPARDVPPMTTARMASISSHRPVLLGSAAVAST